MNYEFINVFENTTEVKIPKDPLQQIIGQTNAVNLAKIVAKQRRNLLLVGPPGTGKSLIAQSIAFHLTKPTQEVSVLHNPENRRCSHQAMYPLSIRRETGSALAR